MTKFHPVKLELLRPGPAENQLLSTLTDYLALCGEGAPITFRIELNHRDLLNCLERLRYLTVQEHVREATVGELSKKAADILSKISTLLVEVSLARNECEPGEQESHYVHLNLVLGGNELSLIPFEMAFAPQSYPGEGLELCLQLDMPVVPTRETRRTLRSLRPWNSVKDPKVLVIVADPQNFGVPLIEHIERLRAAMEPWIGWPSGKADVTDKDRLPFVKERMAVLSNASLKDIRKKCAEDNFTHVHILAHGGEYQLAGEKQFGLVLCADGNPNEKDVVSGKRLANGLQSESSNGAARSSPLVVTLATCDSGNVGSVLVPGGSLAHDLHRAGIPWVFASQFPLTKAGSIRMVDELYPRLLRGDDPRQVLYETRRQLYAGNQRDHDWASLVVYASITPDFDEQVADFFENRSRAAIETALARAEDLADLHPEVLPDALPALEGKLQAILDAWRARLPGKGRTQPQDSERRVECYGMHGSVYKRIGLLRMYRYLQRKDKQLKVKAEGMLRKSLEYYRRAIEGISPTLETFHWVATQALSVAAVLGQELDAKTLKAAREIAEHNLQRGQPGEQAFAHASLAELEMLAASQGAKNKRSIQDATKKVVEHCRQIVALAGRDSFQVASTRRQFKRYVDYWPDRPWRTIAERAVAELHPPR